MTKEKSHLAIGLVVGIGLAALFFQFFAPRYVMVKSGDTLIRQDKWSGNSWRFVDNQWKSIMSANRDWSNIDQTLRKALHIPAGEHDRGDTLQLLKEKYHVLKDVGDYELLERIKIVYSKEILCNLYLSNFAKLGEKTE